MTTNSLDRKIGVLGLSANLINIIIGAGIFALPAIVAANLGSASIYAYLFCGILISLVMLCFAEVGSKITKSGGVYSYIEVSFGRYFGYLTAIFFSLAAISADAAVANALVNLLGAYIPLFQEKIIQILFFLIVFGGLAWINIKGVKESIVLVKTITFLKIVPLLALIFFSIPESNIANLKIESFPDLESLSQTALILFFAFQGAESGLSVSGEVIKPNKTIPKAILISILCVLTIYISLQLVSQGVLGDDLPNYTESPLSEVASHIFGPAGFLLISIGAAVSMFGNLSSEIFSMPRVLFQASQDRIINIQALSRVHKIFGTPFISIIMYSSIGFVFASIGRFDQLAVISSAAVLFIYLGVVLCVFKLRIIKPSKDKDAFTIPGGLIIPILSSVVIILMLFGLKRSEWIGFLAGTAVLTIIYFLKKKFFFK
ncbi:APC family permease [Mangrovivirga sp. M17]|uniref:APC family permease n=1 Tax=Mangrovivirga halotolerans TaxID=2993936 RepID=A0ABT3RUM4_9BACT|nr:APC family permease [Mangrovivirga halotolerans]MCX2745351.1 APC family permease [Mangrovivirga halotolerans]